MVYVNRLRRFERRDMKTDEEEMRDDGKRTGRREMEDRRWDETWRWDGDVRRDRRIEDGIEKIDKTGMGRKMRNGRHGR